MENKKESKTYAVIGILTFVFIMSLFILLGQKARAQESNLPPIIIGTKCQKNPPASAGG